MPQARLLPLGWSSQASKIFATVAVWFLAFSFPLYLVIWRNFEDAETCRLGCAFAVPLYISLAFVLFRRSLFSFKSLLPGLLWFVSLVGIFLLLDVATNENIWQSNTVSVVVTWALLIGSALADYLIAGKCRRGVLIAIAAAPSTFWLFVTRLYWLDGESLHRWVQKAGLEEAGLRLLLVLPVVWLLLWGGSLVLISPYKRLRWAMQETRKWVDISLPSNLRRLTTVLFFVAGEESLELVEPVEAAVENYKRQMSFSRELAEKTFIHDMSFAVRILRTRFEQLTGLAHLSAFRR